MKQRIYDFDFFKPRTKTTFQKIIQKLNVVQLTILVFSLNLLMGFFALYYINPKISNYSTNDIVLSQLKQDHSIENIKKKKIDMINYLKSHSISSPIVAPITQEEWVEYHKIMSKK